MAYGGAVDGADGNASCRRSSMPAAHLQQILQHRLFCNLLQGMQGRAQRGR